MKHLLFPTFAALALAACTPQEVVPFDAASAALHDAHPKGSAASALVADLAADGYVPARAFPDSPQHCLKQQSPAPLIGAVFRTVCYDQDDQGRITRLSLYQIAAGL
ncbi:MAG: hypothetical protein K8F59_01620 [Rhodobacteraceae bacterium]|nr:hypothetical protein [Paracoccaceae bacterium]